MNQDVMAGLLVGSFAGAAITTFLHRVHARFMERTAGPPPKTAEQDRDECVGLLMTMLGAPLEDPPKTVDPPLDLVAAKWWRVPDASRFVIILGMDNLRIGEDKKNEVRWVHTVPFGEDAAGVLLRFLKAAA